MAWIREYKKIALVYCITAAMQRRQGQFDGWQVPPRYRLVKVLGQGTYGTVVQAIDKSTGRRVAIKRVSDVFDPKLPTASLDSRRLLREICILRLLDHHAAIVDLLDLFAAPGTTASTLTDVYMVFRHYETDLNKVILSPMAMTEAHVRSIVYQLLCALLYLHSAFVTHRDLKPANILANSDVSIALADLGLCRVLAQPALPPEEDPRPMTGETMLSRSRSRNRARAASHGGAMSRGIGSAIPSPLASPVRALLSPPRYGAPPVTTAPSSAGAGEGRQRH